MSTHSTSTRNLVASKLAADPIAKINPRAFITVVVEYFIAFERRVRPSTIRAGSPDVLLAGPKVRRHYARYAKAAGGRSVANLVSAALAWHYFGPASQRS